MLRFFYPFFRSRKPQNILLTGDDLHTTTLKIADFGFAREVVDSNLLETVCGTPLYMAPELLELQKYDPKVDLWSIGAVFYQILVGKPPYEALNSMDLRSKIKRSEAAIPADINLSDEAKSLIRGLLQRNPSHRISFNEFFNHPFFQGKITNSSDSVVLVNSEDFKEAETEISKDKNVSELKNSDPYRKPIAESIQVRNYFVKNTTIKNRDSPSKPREIENRARALVRAGDSYLENAFSTLMDSSASLSEYESKALNFVDSDMEETLFGLDGEIRALCLYTEALRFLGDHLNEFKTVNSLTPQGHAELKSLLFEVTKKCEVHCDSVESEVERASSVVCVEKLVYDAAIQFIRDGATLELMEDRPSAVSKYNDAGYLLKYLLSDRHASERDMKIIRHYLGIIDKRLHCI